MGRDSCIDPCLASPDSGPWDKYMCKQPGTQDRFRACKKYIKTSYQQTERVAISVKGIVSMSLSSQIKENTIIIYLTALLASCLDEAKLLIKHWTIPLNKDTPPIDSNLICPRELRLISFSGWFLRIVNVFPISKRLSQGYNFYNSFCPRVVTNLGTAI